MAYRKLEQFQYDAMVSVYRAGGSVPNHQAAATAAGVDRGTAKNVFERGHAKMGWRPVCEILAEELVGRRVKRANKLVDAARSRARKLLSDARLQAEREVAVLMVQAERQMQAQLDQAEAAGEAALEAAEEQAQVRLQRVEEEAAERVQKVYERMRLDAAEQASEEVLLSKSARKNTLQAHGFMAMAWSNARSLAEQLKAKIDGKDLTLKQIRELFRDMTQAQRNLVQASKQAIELERLRVGDPTEHVHLTVEPATLREAEESLTSAFDLLTLAKRRAEERGRPGDPGHPHNLPVVAPGPGDPGDGASGPTGPSGAN